ncbi:unnamed protein product [Pieris macdunnoughi]|uniref:Uncharacterized protein n=1 Tax=Pieris macdunnoughi TaxID=345717 RepID=A0A821MMA5_9NEOP|nr:unnamed protein product [Pieris macdunnoughi]
MSRYLWGIAQIVNDPSAELLNIIKSRIASHTQENIPDSNNSAEEVILKKNKSVQVCTFNPELSDKKPIEVQSKLIQVRSRTKLRQNMSSQCDPLNDFQSKATNTEHISTIDCGTSCDIYKFPRNAKTDPMKHKVCSEHRQVFNILENWSDSRMQSNETSDINSLWLKIKNNLKWFQIKKIESLPEYYQTDKHSIVLMLYTRVNFK